MFHKDPVHSGFTLSVAPSTPNLLWSKKIGDPARDGRALSSPVLANGRIYVASSNGIMQCLNLINGDNIWSFKTRDHISSAPYVTSSWVYIGSEDGYLYCLNANTGSEKWKCFTGKIGSSPIVYNNKIYVGSGDGFLYCLDTLTGAFLWKHAVGIVYHSSPAIANGFVYIIGGYAYCLNANTGEEVWKATTSTDGNASPVINNGVVYIPYSLPGWGRLDCLNASTGSPLWSFTPGAAVCSTPALAYNKIYFGSCDRSMYCLDAATGRKIWDYTIAGYEIRSSPAVANGMVYFTDDNLDMKNGKIYCLNAETGTQIWTYNTGNMGGRSSPAIGYNSMVVASGDSLYVFMNGIIVDVFLSDDRCDLGTLQEIKFHLLWSNNNSDVKNGLMFINGTEFFTNSTGWINIKYNTSIVGKRVWMIEGVKYGDITDYVASINDPSIVWDRVLVSWLPYSKRLNVGTDVSGYLQGKYEYDGLSFQGKILLNDTVKQNIGTYHYSVKEIEDRKYGLTAYTSKPAEFIFDRVNINLQLDNPRVQVGKTPVINIQGLYEYDKAPFEGTVVFDKSLTSNDIGKRSFTVSSINDPQYSLTAFTSNEVICIFDTILPKVEIDTNTPSKATVKVSLQYETDKSPVNDAEVSINGVKADTVSDGVYSATFTSLNPSNEFKLFIKRDGFDPIESSYSVLSIGNIVLEGLLASALIVGVALNIHSRRRHVREIYQIKLSKLEEYVQSQGRIEFSNTSKILSLDETELRRLLDALVKEKRIKGYPLKDDKGFITEEKAVEEARRRLE
jgi:outer membrane protein assembly factor BamB